MSSAQLEKVLNLYKRVHQIPNLAKARVVIEGKNTVIVDSTWSQENLERKKKQKFLKQYVFNNDLQPLLKSSPIDVSTELMTATSKDENFKAVLRDIIVDGKSKQFIEIWDRMHLNKSYDLSAFDVHGDVYVEPTFSSFHLSSDNTRLLYIAEKKPSKTEPFYKQKPKPKKEKVDDEEEPSKGTEYVFKPDWGEQLVGKHHSVIVILNFKEDTIVPLDSIPDDYFPAQVIWAPNDNDIVGVAYKLKKRYFGLYACTNRESYIFQLKNGNFCKITEEGLFCTSPRLSPDGKNLIWLERDVSSPHRMVMRLMNQKFGSNKPVKLIDSIKTNVTISDNKLFYGIFEEYLPKRCWSSDSKYIFFRTAQKSDIKSYIIDLETQTLTEIESPDRSSLSVIDINQNFALFVKYSLIKPSQLFISKFDSETIKSGNFTLIECSESIDILDGENLMYEHTEFVYSNEDPVKDFGFTYFGKKNEVNQSVPLIVTAHGGPCASYSNVFLANSTFFALLGFGILQVNYRGSTGRGGDNVNYLLGKVGKVDILDCVTAIDQALKKYSWLDPKKVNLLGGSHGGFINAHLSGQYPDKFKSVILLNPVVDIAAMFSVTDIPEWCRAVSGYPMIEKLPVENVAEEYNKTLSKMLEHSPIMHVDKVKVPTLIGLGSKDVRVPFSQGKLWYNRLLTNNVKTKLYLYEDNHSLGKDEVTVDITLNSALWFLEHNME